MKKTVFKIFFTFTFCLFCLVNSIVAQQDVQKTDSSVASNPVVDTILQNRVAALEKQVAVEKKGESHFMVVGLATMGFMYNKSVTTINGIGTTTKTSSFPDIDRFEISPMMLWRHGKKLLFEFEPSWNGTSFGVNWGDVSYFVKPGFIVRGGYIVLPFGIYNKRLAAGWINKLASDPVGIADYPPSSDYGVEITGGLPLGNMKWSYDVSLTNGMQLLNDGTMQSSGIVDNNINKTLTGRISILPFSNSCLELGVSGLYGGIGDANSNYKNAKSNMYALDFNFVKTVSKILLNVKAQYNYINVTNENYVNPTDTNSTYSFNNKTTSFFGQLSMRATSAPGVLKNFELASRYVNYTTPVNSIWGAITDEYDIGIDYWFTWRSVLKVVYESQKITGTTPISLGGYLSNSTQNNRIVIQYSVQF